MTQNETELEKMSSLEVFELFGEWEQYAGSAGSMMSVQPKFTYGEVVSELKWRLKLADNYLNGD